MDILKICMTGLIIALLSGPAPAQRVSESLDDWTMGTNQPEITSGTRGDGSTGSYIHLLIGTSSMYYEVMEEGEGTAVLWVHDPGRCLETTDPGYGTNGPRWGFQSPLYQSISVGVARASYVAGCQGYSPWSTVAPYSFYWFKDGMRASHSAPFTTGWTRWTIAGTWDDITFTAHDVDYDEIDGRDGYNLVRGDVSQTYDALTFGGTWEALFGEGWQALWLQGDTPTGIEDMNIDITGGTGVFEAGLGALAVAGQYERASWSDIKKVFR